MIIAKVHGVLPQSSVMLIQFSEPDGTFNEVKEPLTVVNSESDLLRRLYVKNKVYICNTLERWLNQREHSNNSNRYTIRELQALIALVRGYSYENLCKTIASHKNKFEQLIHDKSRFHDHYLKVVKPILEECDNVYTGKAKVHYC